MLSLEIYLGLEYYSKVILDENNILHFSGHNPSYSSSPVVWIRQASLQSDIQKVLRHARKMPEKTPHSFYKGLNRIRKAALSIEFYELMDGVASIFEKNVLFYQVNNFTGIINMLSQHVLGLFYFLGLPTSLLT